MPLCAHMRQLHTVWQSRSSKQNFYIFKVTGSLDKWRKAKTRVKSSPKHKEKEEEYENNQQNQVWYHLGLQVLLVVWCAIPRFKLDVSSRGHSGIKTAGLQACSTSS